MGRINPGWLAIAGAALLTVGVAAQFGTLHLPARSHAHGVAPAQTAVQAQKGRGASNLVAPPSTTPKPSSTPPPASGGGDDGD